MLFLLMLLLSGIICFFLFFDVSDTPKIVEQQHIIFNGNAKQIRKTEADFDVMNSLNRFISPNSSNKHASRQKIALRSKHSNDKYVGNLSLQNSGGFGSGSATAIGGFSANGNTGNSHYFMGAIYSSSGSASINSPIAYAPQYAPPVNNRLYTGFNRAYTSTITEMGAPISSLSAALFTGDHTHVDLDGDGYCDKGDGYYLDYRPGEGTGEFEEVWVPLDADWILLIISLFSLLITYQKIQK